MSGSGLLSGLGLRPTPGSRTGGNANPAWKTWAENGGWAIPQRKSRMMFPEGGKGILSLQKLKTRCHLQVARAKAAKRSPPLLHTTAPPPPCSPPPSLPFLFQDRLICTSWVPLCTCSRPPQMPGVIWSPSEVPATPSGNTASASCQPPPQLWLHYLS